MKGRLVHVKRLFAALIALTLMTSSYAPALAKTPQPTATAASGLSEGEVRRIQQRLIDLDFLSGSADGQYGKQTKNAVKSFQAAASKVGYELSADGIIGSKTLKALEDDELARRLLTPRKGDSGTHVTKMQQRLVNLGYLTSPPDGAFGSKAEAALAAFQQMLIDEGMGGISANGILDENTRTYLYGYDLSGFDMRTPVFFDDSNPLALEDCYLYAESCIVMNADTGEVLLAKNADERMYPASTTKLMTLLIALTRGNLKKSVTVPESADSVPGDSSRVPVHAGEVMPYSDLLFGLMIKSGNDAANAVATLTSGSIPKFVNAMNNKAAELGMQNTHFENAHGYHDDNHYTTSADMARLMCEVMRDDKARKVISARSYTMAATTLRGKELKLTNTYELLSSSSDHYYPHAIGGKTGYTSKAGQCFVGAAEKDGTTLVVAVLNSGARKTDKWDDARRLFAYGFAK